MRVARRLPPRLWHKGSAAYERRLPPMRLTPGRPHSGTYCARSSAVEHTNRERQPRVPRQLCWLRACVTVYGLSRIRAPRHDSLTMLFENSTEKERDQPPRGPASGGGGYLAASQDIDVQAGKATEARETLWGPGRRPAPGAPVGLVLRRVPRGRAAVLLGAHRAGRDRLHDGQDAGSADEGAAAGGGGGARRMVRRPRPGRRLDWTRRMRYEGVDARRRSGNA